MTLHVHASCSGIQCMCHSVCVCVHVCVRACVCACMCACVLSVEHALKGISNNLTQRLERFDCFPINLGKFSREVSFTDVQFATKIELLF